MPTEVHHPRLSLRRNRSGFLWGATWSHDPRWPNRLTHFYLGWWTLMVRTNGKHGGATAHEEGDVNQ